MCIRDSADAQQRFGGQQFVNQAIDARLGLVAAQPGGRAGRAPDDVAAQRDQGGAVVVAAQVEGQDAGAGVVDGQEGGALAAGRRAAAGFDDQIAIE